MRKPGESLHNFSRLRTTGQSYAKPRRLLRIAHAARGFALASACDRRSALRMPLLYRSEYITSEIAPAPLRLQGGSLALLGRHFDHAIQRIFLDLQQHFATRAAGVHYDPARQQIEIMYRMEDTEPDTYFQFQATVATLVNLDELSPRPAADADGAFGAIGAAAATPGEQPAATALDGVIEVYPVITASVKRIQHGYWTVFDNADRLHEQLAAEIRRVIDPPPGTIAPHLETEESGQ